MLLLLKHLLVSYRTLQFAQIGKCCIHRKLNKVFFPFTMWLVYCAILNYFILFGKNSFKTVFFSKYLADTVLVSL